MVRFLRNLYKTKPKKVLKAKGKRVNTMRLDKVKAQWDILQMKAAYIAAERDIINDASLTNWQEIAEPGKTIVTDMTPEQYNNLFAKEQNLTIKQIQEKELEANLQTMEEKGRELLSDEKYELFAELKEMYDHTKRMLDKLRGNS